MFGKGRGFPLLGSSFSSEQQIRCRENCSLSLQSLSRLLLLPFQQPIKNLKNYFNSLFFFYFKSGTVNSEQQAFTHSLLILCLTIQGSSVASSVSPSEYLVHTHTEWWERERKKRTQTAVGTGTHTSQSMLTGKAECIRAKHLWNTALQSTLLNSCLHLCIPQALSRSDTHTNIGHHESLEDISQMKKNIYFFYFNVSTLYLSWQISYTGRHRTKDFHWCNIIWLRHWQKSQCPRHFHQGGGWVRR